MHNKKTKILESLFVLCIVSLFFFLIYIDVFDSEKQGIGADNTVPDVDIDFCFVGDILLSSNVEDLINRTNSVFPFENVKGILSSNDFVIGNLENPISTRGKVLINKQFNFRTDPKVIEGLKYAGFNILSLGNNHIMDYGSPAMTDTLNILKNNNIYYTGAGNNIDEAGRPVIVEKNGKRIAFISASRVLESVSLYAKENQPGVFQAYLPEKLFQTINETDKLVDFVIVYIHWGIERDFYPKSYQRTLAKNMIDQGADLVVGSHPHVLQGFEYYNDKLIAYSLGNFVFTDTKKESMILKIKLTHDNTYSSEVIPCIIKNYRPEPLNNFKLINEFYNSMTKRSFSISIEDGKIIQNCID